MLFERAAAADRMRAVGTLAAGVAHEINSPLAFVSNMLQALSRNNVAPADEHVLLDDAIAATERIASIASSLRTLSHTRDEALESVDVVESLKFALKMVAPELRGHADLVESYAPDLPRVRAQEGRLGQVFINLLLNAAHATRDVGRGEVRVVARRDGARVVVEVSDTGPGVPESLRSRVFEPFFTTKPVGMGTGLGLAICRTIIAGFGGEIALDAGVERGATFRVKLPIAERQRPARRLRILLLDDDESFVKTLRMMLERDHHVRETTRADDALAILDGGERFDAILCDMSMPEMSGMAFHDRVHALATEQARRIVYISGASGGELDSFFARVDNRRLPKPFRAEDLERVLAEITA
jgi:CheY-like chemotaxis protein